MTNRMEDLPVGKINVFAAHPDDCEISIGCILLSLLRRQCPRDLRIIYASRGELLKGKRDPRRFFGTPFVLSDPVEIHYLDQKDGEVTENSALRTIVEKLTSKKDLNLVHWPLDTHRDHRELSNTVNDVFRGKNIIYYRSVSSENFTPNLLFEFPISDLDRKVNELKSSFDLDRPYLEREFFERDCYQGIFTEYLHVKNCSFDRLKLLR